VSAGQEQQYKQHIHADKNYLREMNFLLTARFVVHYIQHPHKQLSGVSKKTYTAHEMD